MSYAWESAASLAAQVRSGETSARALTEACLARIEATDLELNCFLRTDAQGALSAADAVDAKRAAGQELGPLAGVPLGLKDNLCTEGLETTAGSRMLRGHRPLFDADAVSRLKAADAVVIGKLNMDEFGMGSSTEHGPDGPTRNPWDRSRVPGGSSGGSAAAVAGGLVPLSLGSDTGGSIRQPAALCGCVGVKPSYGLVSRSGLIAFASSLDVVGPLTRSVADAALALDALVGIDPADMTTRALAGAGPAPFSAALKGASLEGKVLGLVREYRELTEDAGVWSVVEAALDAARAAGAEVREVSLDLTSAAIPTYQVVSTAEASSNLGRYDGIHYGHRSQAPGDLVQLMSRSRAEAFGPEVQRRILLGTFVLSSGFYDAYYLKAQQVRRQIAAAFARALDGVDALIGPTSPLPAFKLGEREQDPLAMYAVDVFTVSTNLAGLPAISLPAGSVSPEGTALPVGVQLTGRRDSDPALLALAAGLEAALALPATRPTGLGGGA